MDSMLESTGGGDGDGSDDGRGRDDDQALQDGQEAETQAPSPQRRRLNPGLVAQHSYFPGSAEHVADEVSARDRRGRWWTRLNNGGVCEENQSLVLPILQVGEPVFPGQAYPLRFGLHELAIACQDLPEDQVLMTWGFQIPRVIGLWAQNNDGTNVGTIARLVRYSRTAIEDTSSDEGEDGPQAGPQDIVFVLTWGLMRARMVQNLSGTDLSRDYWTLAVVAPIRDALPDPVRGESRHATSVPKLVHDRFDALRLAQKAALLGKRFLLPCDYHYAQKTARDAELANLRLSESDPNDELLSGAGPTLEELQGEEHQQGEEANDDNVGDAESTSEKAPFVAIPTTRADAVAFSYWVAANVPTTQTSTRLDLFNVDDVSERLLRCINLLENTRQTIACGQCGVKLCTTDDVVVMSTQGSTGNFVNPQGHVHHLMTTLKCSQSRLVSPPETAHSYFPGYSWTIMACAQCYNMLGWRFDAVDQKLTQKWFYALVRDNVVATQGTQSGQ